MGTIHSSQSCNNKLVSVKRLQQCSIVELPKLDGLVSTTCQDYVFSNSVSIGYLKIPQLIIILWNSHFSNFFTMTNVPEYTFARVHVV